MIKNQTGNSIVYVKPGELYFSNKPEIISTVLGSCVAVIMYESGLGICGISHGVLPSGKESTTDKLKNDFKFVDHSIKSMLEFFDKKKIPRTRLIVKVFGGAEQLGYDGQRRQSIGKQNILKTIELLEEAGLKIVSMDVGGNLGRKLYLYSGTGEVYLSKLEKIKKPHKAKIL